MEPDIRIELASFKDSETGQSGICLEVTNAGQVTVDDLELDFVYEFEKPVPREEQRPGMEPLSLGQTAGSFNFSLPLGHKKGPIKPGHRRLYALSVCIMPQVKSLVESLSSERYYIRATIDGEQEVGIPGNEFGEFVGSVFED
jgi:hypothetical protein